MWYWTSMRARKQTQWKQNHTEIPAVQTNRLGFSLYFSAYNNEFVVISMTYQLVRIDKISENVKGNK